MNYDYMEHQAVLGTLQVMRSLGIDDSMYSRLFDDAGWPLDMPGTNAALHASVIPQDVSVWLLGIQRHPISNVLRADYQGRPMVAPSLPELSSLFPSIADLEGSGQPMHSTSIPRALDSGLLAMLQREDAFFGILFHHHPEARQQELRNALQLRLTWSLETLRALRWATCVWPVKGGNPFEPKLLASNAASFGVDPDWYFSIVKTPMDLTRMAERLGRGLYRDKGVDQGNELFWADVEQVARNAKAYNGPAELQSASTPDSAFPHPSTLVAAYSSAEGSIYGMAFEFCETAKAARAAITSGRPLSERLTLRNFAKNAAGQMGAGAAWYIAPEQQAGLLSATKAQAASAGVPSSLLQTLLKEAS